ncbi:hypothetical protein ACRXCV_14240 [Halobacteriovorax sp. GFR7]|uniref:hypothetical protein n=1 Tax=unclassified Halobacteriovorax TaxID=2639665 RepID=UPI003D96E4A2
MKFKEVVKAMLAWFSLPFILAHIKYFIPLITAIPFLFGMALIWFTNEYRRTYDIDYEDRSETLAGIDANGNGMRDDLERFGEEAYKDWDPLVLKAYYNWLKNLYVVMENKAHVDNDKKIDYINSRSCWLLLQRKKKITNSFVDTSIKKIHSQVFKLSFNTAQRKSILDENWFLYQTSISSQDIINLKYACVDLNLSKYEMFLLQKRSLTDVNGEIRIEKNLSTKFFNEKPRLYENNIDFDYYKDKILSRGEVYEDFYNNLNNIVK